MSDTTDTAPAEGDNAEETTAVDPGVVGRYEMAAAKYVDAAQIPAIRARFEERADELRQSQSLNEQGIKIEIAKEWERARTEIDTLREELATKVDTERGTKERRLFGPANAEPMERVAHREALDRAEGLADEASAIAAVRRAKFSNDESMLRAITFRASEKGWGNALDAVEKAAPGTHGRLAELSDLPGTQDMVAGTFFRLPVPREFGTGTFAGGNAAEVRRWASRG